MRDRGRTLSRRVRRLLERITRWRFWEHWSVPVVAAGVAGIVIEDIWAVLVFALIGYIVGEASQLLRLSKWLASPRQTEPPILKGISGYLARQIYALQQRLKNRLDRRGLFLKDLRSFISRLPNALVLLDKHLRVEWANKQAERLLGVRWPDDAGIRITHLLRHPDMVKAFRHLPEEEAGLRLTLADKPETILDFQFMVRSDERIVILVRDISKSQRLDRMRQDFVTNASHELRTPLTVLSGVTELLLEEAHKAPDDWQPKLKMINNQVSYMRELTDDLLSLSIVEDERNRKADDNIIDIRHLCQRVSDELADLINKRQLRLQVECTSDRALRGQESEIHLTLLNLISNAIRHTEPGGRIIVRWLTGPEGARLEVEDNGVGIATRHISRLTERFYRVDQDRGRSEGGSGLGLAIVRHVLDKHQATLQIESTPGKGSRFVCLFPEKHLR